MLVHIKTDAPYSQHVTGRDTDNSCHCEDASTDLPVVGMVEEDKVRPTDTIITEQEYLQLVASIQAHNQGLPPADVPRSPTELLKLRLAAATTDAERIQILLIGAGLIEES